MLPESETWGVGGLPGEVQGVRAQQGNRDVKGHLVQKKRRRRRGTVGDARNLQTLLWDIGKGRGGHTRCELEDKGKCYGTIRQEIGDRERGCGVKSRGK